MNWSRAVVLLAALVVTAGCGGWSSATTEPVTRVQGVLVRVGGPPPGAAVALADVRLHLDGRGGSADVRTDRDGRFALDLPPGTYHVTITAGGPEANARPIQPVPRVIHVPHAGRLRLVVNIK